MKNVYYLIKKNLKILIRSKSSALIVIFAPLILILLIGFAYNTSQTGLNIGVYSPQFTEEISSFLNSLPEEEYKIIKYDNSEECVEDIKLGFTHTCLVLPENFQIQDNSKKEITFYIDQSKINLVYLITDTLNKKFNLKSQEISQELTSGVLTKLFDTKTKIEEKSGQVDQAKTKNQQAVSQTSTIQSDLTSLDLSVPSTDHNISSLEDIREDVNEKLDEVISLVVSSNLNSSDKSIFKEKLNKISNKIVGNGSGTLEEVSSLISSLYADLNTTMIKLTAASETVSSAETQLSSLASSLNEGIAVLNAIKATLTEIHEDIVSQKVTDASTISAPLTTKIERVTAEKTHLNYMFPSLMVLAVMFISLLLGTTLVMIEKHNQAYFRNFIVPVKKIAFVFSTYLTNSLLVLIQIAVILGFSLIFLKDIFTQLHLTALILFVSSSVFTLIGMIVGYLFTSEDTGTLASISFGALFLFVSGTILPLESMPTAIRQITHFNPFVLGEKLIREIFIFKSPFAIVFNDLLLLAGYSLILFILILIIDSLSSKHFLTKALYKHYKHVKEKKQKESKIKKLFHLSH